MKDIRFKNIEEADLAVALDIYNYYIKTTTATFRLEPITIDVFKSFIFLDHPKYKAYLIYHQDEIVGFCFVTQYKNLPAYDHTAEMGVYLKPDFTRLGLGPEATKHLEQTAAGNGIKVLIASISGENTASLKLMRKLGYDECGHFKNVGEKWGRIIDVIYFQKELLDRG
jgi:L-amino acid N-acyltransferase YncA